MPFLWNKNSAHTWGQCIVSLLAFRNLDFLRYMHFIACSLFLWHCMAVKIKITAMHYRCLFFTAALTYNLPVCSPLLSVAVAHRQVNIPCNAPFSSFSKISDISSSQCTFPLEVCLRETISLFHLLIISQAAPRLLL